MKSHADKQPKSENRSKAVATRVPSSPDNAAFQFSDNRPETLAQTELGALMHESQQSKKAIQLQAMMNPDSFSFPPQKKNTGLPVQLKAGIEQLSGYSMDDVSVHYNSGKPAQLNALAYAQGTDIYLSPGQEKHLAHEAWHVVQQKQRRVAPSTSLKKGVAINADAQLEKEADTMGEKALQLKAMPGSTPAHVQGTTGKVIQCFLGDTPNDGAGTDFVSDTVDLVEEYRAELNTQGYTSVNHHTKEREAIGRRGNITMGHLIITHADQTAETKTFGPLISGNPQAEDGEKLYGEDETVSGKDTAKNPMCSEPKVLDSLREFVSENRVPRSSDMTLLLYSENTCCESCITLVPALIRDMPNLEIRVYATRHQGRNIVVDEGQIGVFYRYFPPLVERDPGGDFTVVADKAKRKGRAK